MTIEAFREINFQSARRKLIDHLVEIIGEYDQKLTARQVFYQFVSRLLVENTEKSYRMITSLLTDARYAGLVDWDAIEDRGREPSIPLEFRDLDHRVDSALNNYRLDRWEGQTTHVELWVEKQALAGVLAPLAHEYHVPMMVNKGYSSASAMKESADRIRAACGWDADEMKALEEQVNEELADEDPSSDEYQATIQRYAKEMHEKTKEAVILYLGDHDPSGEDMVRDVDARLREFHVRKLTVFKVALTMQQIKQYKPPPNPAKLTDSRATAYIEKFGTKSWELDALPPRELTRIIRRSLDKLIDRERMDAVIAREGRDKEILRKAFEKTRKRR